MEDEIAPTGPDGQPHPADSKRPGAPEEAGELEEETPLVASGAVKKPPGSASGTVSREQLEAALERVVRKVFAGKIEKMVVEIIDEAVSRELERIRALIEAGGFETQKER